MKKFLFTIFLGSLFSANAGADDTPSLPDKQGSSTQSAELVAQAVRFEHGEGVPRDYGKAVELYCRAARTGDANAQFALGWMYANGRGLAKDDGVAAQFFAMAAEQGHAHARDMLRYVRPSPTSALPDCMLPDKPVMNAGIAGTQDQPQIVDTDFSRGHISEIVRSLSPIYEVDPKLVLAVITVESNFNVHARSPKNARGLMQLIPETANRFNVKNPFNPSDNIKGGLAYLQWLLAYYRGNVSLVAAAYNAGEKAVEKFRGIPPYPETIDYVKKITRLYKKKTHPYVASVVEPSALVNSPKGRRRIDQGEQLSSAPSSRKS